MGTRSTTPSLAVGRNCLAHTSCTTSCSPDPRQAGRYLLDSSDNPHGTVQRASRSMCPLGISHTNSAKKHFPLRCTSLACRPSTGRATETQNSDSTFPSGTPRRCLLQWPLRLGTPFLLGTSCIH